LDAEDKLVLCFQSYIVRTPRHVVLVDSCIGNDKERPARPIWDKKQDNVFMSGLAEVGLTVDDIDFVLCTHLHVDHVGWNTRLENGRWVPTFANARYLFSRRDFEHFGRQQIEDDHLRAFRDSVLPVYDAGRAELIEPDISVHRQIGDGVWLEPAFGHSPGNFSVFAQAGGERAIFWGDVIHHPVQLVHPALPMSFDGDPEQARQTRQRILRMAVETQLVCFPAHFRDPSAGRVLRDGDCYRYRFLE
jgi:glyoxylase-like metal-dependent hydrolase (beta-lactamase superfamily II)